MADDEPTAEDLLAMAQHPLAAVWRAGSDAATSPDFRDANGELNEAAYVRYALNVMRRVHREVVAAAESQGRTAGYAEAVRALRNDHEFWTFMEGHRHGEDMVEVANNPNGIAAEYLEASAAIPEESTDG